MKRSTFLRTSVALAAGLAAAGCSKGTGSSAGGGASSTSSWTIPDKDPTATITVVGIVDNNADGIAKVLDAFRKAHPNITVQYQYVPFDNLNSVIDSRITSKTGNPDVYWVDQPRVPALATRGYLEDLTSQFGGLTSGLQKSTVDASTFHDKLWSLPIANSTQLLYYNLDLLKKAGVKPPSTDPEQRISWQQLKKDAQKVQQSANAQYGLLFGQPNRYYQLEPLPASAGGGVGATGDENLTPEISNDGWVSSMAYYGSLFADKVSPRGIASEQMSPTFLAGKTAYFEQGNWLVPQMATAKFRWGAALNPVWEGGKPVTPTGSWSVGINPFSQHKGAAAIFIRWLAIDGEGGYGKYRAYAELPANIEGQRAYLNSSAFTGSTAGKQAGKVVDYETANTALARVSTVGYIEFEDITGRAFSDISNGTDPKKALDSAQQQLVTAWKKYK